MRLGEATLAKLQGLFQRHELLNPIVSDPDNQDTSQAAKFEPQIKKATPRRSPEECAAITEGRNFGNEKSRALLQAPWLLLLLTVLVVLSLTQLSTIEIRRVVSSKTQAAMPKKLKDMRFASCDQKDKIKFLSEDQCEIDTTSGSRQKVKYTLLFANPDLATFLMGYLRRNELWYHYNASGLVGSDGIVLYNPNSAELAIVKKMWWYANFADRYYKESKRYPNDAEKCKRSNPNYLYINPITHLSDFATIVVQKQINADRILSKSNEQQWRPGGIFCQSLEGKKFFIQGCDEDGKPLTTAVPGRYFTIICDNGINLTEREQSQALKQPKSPETNSATRVYLYQTPELEASVQWERRLCQLLLWSAFILTGFWCYACHRSKSSHQARFAAIGATVLCVLGLAAWYICAFFG